MDFSNKINNFIDHYVDLLIAQYHDVPRAKATINAVIAELIANGLVWQLERAFDIDTAIGNQLTILGKYVGAPRNAIGFNSKPEFFCFIDSNTFIIDEHTHGFNSSDAILEPGVAFFSCFYYSSANFMINDDDLRNIVRLKIETNWMYSTFKEIKKILFKYFPSEISIYDNTNMRLIAFCSKNISLLIKLIIYLNFLSVPIGCKINTYILDDANKFFSFISCDPNDNISISEGLSDSETKIVAGDFIDCYNVL